ncbi:radical SAM protein [Rhizobium sp. AG855]|uniref:B12-binding domain-containing radical SAM protein n=1 Tax=Rhizobium sp. AG855 TaxID=2183898 RepID=UPI000E760411|nr:radical SAM protein [Rhizobium sp. AG855]RKE76999.1 radical SAM superfamily enzyme YgiQ (UPF0313 family) [Rhizobium sp. AG855]
MRGEFNYSANNLDLLLLNSPLKNYELFPKLNDFTLPTLGLGYIATCAEAHGFNVEVIDAEALGLGVSQLAEIVNKKSPRWVGLNLLAPTYQNSIEILRQLTPDIRIMLGGHQAKAMPTTILKERRIPRIDALVLGEAETRVPILLGDVESRQSLPQVFWREGDVAVMPKVTGYDPSLLAPDINTLPFVDRKHLQQDPYMDGLVRESAMVASRGCPFDCSFCGAAISANPDVTIRMRKPHNLIAEIVELRNVHHVERVRFVDDLFLANIKLIREILSAFVEEQIKIQWDATGRINVLANASDDIIDLMVLSGCREVALGIESGSDRLLSHIDKKISVRQILTAVERLCRAGVNVKGYFILGLPTETRQEQQQTVELIYRLQDLTSNLPGRFRCSAFEYRPYPGTPDWKRLVSAGYSEQEMMNYEPETLAELFQEKGLRDRDEFNFSTGIQFGEVPVSETRRTLAELMRRQKEL